MARPALLRPLEALETHGVRYVVIGGIAAIAQGYPLTTHDLDVTPDRNTENLERLARALRDLGVRLRVARGPAVEFPMDASFLGEAASWTFETNEGLSFDVLFEPAGTAGYSDLAQDAVALDLGEGLVAKVASLRDLIRMKQAAGRPKDLAQIPALLATLEEARARGE
ncbi:MAG: hypothetical protein M5U27_00090 [Gaiella sp.]|nr:hypothetical protein [Gaiella sp.]